MDSLFTVNKEAFKCGLGSGCVQVTSFLWLKTLNNYQYKHGYNTIQAFKLLYNDGKILRFYRGYIPAIITASTCKIGDLTGYYFVNNNSNQHLNNLEKNTIIASVSSLTRFIIMPVDTLDTFLQIEGKRGFLLLRTKIKTHGIPVLYYGCTMWLSTNFISSFCWFGTYDILNTYFKNNSNTVVQNGCNGFLATMISDTITNPLRSVKIYKQSHHTNISYTQSFKLMVQEKGLLNGLTRGLFTRIITHGIQGSVFVIIWKKIETIWC